MKPALLTLLALACLTVSWACTSSREYLTPPPSDGDTDVDADLDLSADADARTDSGADAATDSGEGGSGDAASPEGGLGFLEGPGPLTLVVDDLSLSTERLEQCDHDSANGPNNAIADLGTSAPIAATIFSEFLQQNSDRGARLVFHLPWVEDRNALMDTRATLIPFRGLDLDDPPVLDDDFSGTEPFYAHAESVDLCGEPLCHALEARLEGGAIRAEPTCLPIPFRTAAGWLRARSAWLELTLVPGTRRFQARACAYMPIQELGEVPGFRSVGGEYNLLETLAAGGSLVGMDSIPGVRPDVDVDGDGLESFMVDAEGYIEACIDGDSSMIPGNDCWQDDRMADGVSLVVTATVVTASFAGLDQLFGPEGCDVAPEESLWDAR